ncbi:MAG: 50S ribosome-binding GTPase [Candidatus Verstraetearchaeota archaeon]|nr:50S ribosome-binding GTPase [Candidatus Verstraetearchaeota archaeon]
MPANLPPQARAAERRYIEAKTLPEKIKYLQEFISSIPEHKGNEKMRGFLRRRLAELKEELETQKKRKAGSGGGGFSVKKEGAAQVVIVGLPGSGKSSLLASTTNARVQIGDHPFTTKEPSPGMLSFEDLQFQLVDTPAIFEGAYYGLSWGAQLMSVIRNADGMIVLLDGADPVSQYTVIMKELKMAGITIDRPRSKIEIERTTGGGVQIACAGRITCDVNEVEEILKEAGVRNAVVRIWGDAGREEILEALEQTKMYKPALILVNKVDIYPDAVMKFEEAVGKRALGISTKTGVNLSLLGREIFMVLEIIRVYTKEVGGEPTSKPIVMKKGSKVIDVAKIVHSHLYKNFKIARIWGTSAKYDAEKVGADHELADGDVVEIRIK